MLIQLIVSLAIGGVCGFAANKLMKGSDRKFKILYGCEMNMVDSKLRNVYNPVPRSLQDSEYCVLDLETTGLSTRHDYMIEFGGVILHKGIVKQRKDFFTKPPIEVPRKIKELTNGKYLWLRNNVATIVCNCLENFLFYILAFYPSFTMPQIISMGFATCLLEIVIGICDTPFIYAARKIKSGAEA